MSTQNSTINRDSQAYWNKRAATFTRDATSNYERWLMNLLALTEGETILDIGCATGTLTRGGRRTRKPAALLGPAPAHLPGAHGQAPTKCPQGPARAARNRQDPHLRDHHDRPPHALSLLRRGLLRPAPPGSPRAIHRPRAATLRRLRGPTLRARGVTDLSGTTEERWILDYKLPITWVFIGWRTDGSEWA